MEEIKLASVKFKSAGKIYYFSTNLKLKKDMEGLRYTNIPHNISQNKIDKLYGNTLVTSISKLERYRSCPFSYYLQYGLKIKPQEELKIQTLNYYGYFHFI